MSKLVGPAMSGHTSGGSTEPTGEPISTGTAVDESEPPTKRSPWDDARLPWQGHPRRVDLLCWLAFSLSGVYALVMLPLRPVLLGVSPVLLAFLTGSTSAMVTIGALAATGTGSWPLPLVLGAIGVMMFDPIYWWAGKLWGRGLLEVMSGRSPRAARAADRAERFVHRYGAVAILATYLPLPLPGPIVYATVAATGMRLRRFILIDAVGALISRAIYVWIGYSLGQRAVDVVDVVARYALWISLALIVGIVITSFRRRGSHEVSSTM